MLLSLTTTNWLYNEGGLHVVSVWHALYAFHLKPKLDCFLGVKLQSVFKNTAEEVFIKFIFPFSY